LVIFRKTVFEKGDKVSTIDGWGFVEYDNYYELGDRFYNCSGFSHRVTVWFSVGNKKVFSSKEVFNEDEVG